MAQFRYGSLRGATWDCECGQGYNERGFCCDNCGGDPDEIDAARERFLEEEGDQ